MSEELKPCPFCGGEAYITFLYKTPYINCNHSKKCFAKPSTWMISNKSITKQIKAWNRRKNDGKID